MNTEKIAPEKKPKAVVAAIFSLVGALSAAGVPYFGLFAAIVLSVCVLFLSSAKINPVLAFVPALGFVLPALMKDYLSLFIGGTVLVASLFAGYDLAADATFHRGLMKFIFVGFAVFVAGAAVYMKIGGITPADIADRAKEMIRESMTVLIESMGDSLTIENAKLLTEQYEQIAYSAVVYIPSVIGFVIALLGVVALRLTGLLHDLTGCTAYPKYMRYAVLDRGFALIYVLALIIGMVDAGIVGISAGNIMVLMTVPASAAGVTACRSMIFLRRMSRRPGLPFPILIIIASFIFLSPAVGLMMLSLIGVTVAFRKAGPRRKR